VTATVEKRRVVLNYSVESFLAAARKRIFASFLDSIIFLQRQRTLRQIEELIADGRIHELTRDYESAANRLAAKVTEEYVRAGADVAAFLSDGLGTLVSFDVTNDRAVRVLQASKLELIREFVDKQRDAVREALSLGTARGLNPRDQARMFRDAIGLTTRQVRAVANFRRLLEERSSEALTRALRDKRFDRSVLSSIDGDRTLTRAEVDKMVERYRERYLKYRSEVIARTEALRAVHEGSEEAFEQAFDEGLLERDRVVEIWHTAGDERVRGSHAPMNGQRREVGEPFQTGNGNLLRYPGDPRAPASETAQCRCGKSRRVVAERD